MENLIGHSLQLFNLITAMPSIPIFLLLLLLQLLSVPPPCLSHKVTFRSPNLFPEAAVWDRAAQHFLVGSTRAPALHAVSDAGVLHPLISDPDFPDGVGFIGVAADNARGRLVAVASSQGRVPHYNALAAYDAKSGRRLFLAPLSAGEGNDRGLANGLALDSFGNAFVTCALNDLIWKVDVGGNVTVFSKSPLFQYLGQSEYVNTYYGDYGLNGITYSTNGYLLVVHTNTGKVFKVDAVDGTARSVLLPKTLLGADGIAIRKDGTVIVLAQTRAWQLKSDNSWAEGVVYDEVVLDERRSPTDVVVREGERSYALYGSVDEGKWRHDREEFSIEEIEWEKEREGDAVWAFVLLGLGLCYFLYWRFQMGQLVKNMNKKTA